MRAHLYRPIQNEIGNLLYGATVTVRDETASALVAQPLWDSPNEDAQELSNPFSCSDGVLDVWLDAPQRVSVLVQFENRDDVSVSLDAFPPASELVRAETPFVVTNAPTAGQVLVGIDSASASWQAEPTPAPGSVPVHYHEGGGAQSVQLGTSAVADHTGATAVGDQSQATNTSATAFGQQAAATGQRSTALGATATAAGDDSLAAGYFASSPGAQSVAVGRGAVSGGGSSVAVGANALANKNDAVAVGFDASATGLRAVSLGSDSGAQADDSTAVGPGAIAAYPRSTAIGAGAVTTAPDQIVIGTAGQTVLGLGEVRALADALIGGPTSVVAFFGATGATKQTVTGSRGGSAPLAALLTYLASIGLITDNSTA